MVTIVGNNAHDYTCTCNYTHPWCNINTHLFWPNQHSAHTAQSLAFTNLNTLDSIVLWSVTYACLVRMWDRLLVRMQDCSITRLGPLDLLGFKVSHLLGKGTTVSLGCKFTQSLGLRLFTCWGLSFVLIHNLCHVLFHNPWLPLNMLKLCPPTLTLLLFLDLQVCLASWQSRLTECIYWVSSSGSYCLVPHHTFSNSCHWLH